MKSAALFFALMILSGVVANAAEYKKPTDCVVGRKVQDQGNKTGTIVGVEPNGTMCYVRLEGATESTAYIFWMLRDAGASKVTNDKLVPATYGCYTSSSEGMTQSAGFDVTIEGSNRYRSSGGNGKYDLDPKSGRITFKNGPLEKARGQLLPGPDIGLNMNGEDFFNTVCSQNH
jgi:hypothetical protein